MIYNNFSNWYKKVLINTENKIKEIWLKDLRVEDVFLEVLNIWENWIKEIFNLYGINEKLALEIINKWIFNEKIDARKWIYSWLNKNFKDIILWSVKIAASFSKEKASLEDLLLSMLKNDVWLSKLLDYVWINPSDLEQNLEDLNKIWSIDWLAKWNIINWSIEDWMNKLIWAITENLFIWMEDVETPFDNNKNPNDKKQKKESETPALDFFSTDLTAEARAGKLDRVIWRADEIERLIAILNRKTKNNPCLVWDPWVGKTAVIEWLATRIVNWDVPFSMKDKKIFALDMSMLVAWTKYRWEFEARIKQIIEEASKVENEVILFIDEIHTIIWAWSGEWTLDASNILKPAMWRWKIRVIWATTLTEYQKYIEKDSALERRFQKINVLEPSREIALEIISWLKDVFEEYHNLNILPGAVEESVNLSMRYITDRYLPDKAIDLIDEACSLKSMKYNIDEEEIIKLKEKVAELQKKIEQAVVNSQYKKAVWLKQEQKDLEEKIQTLKRKFSIPKEKRLNVDASDIQKVLSIATWIPTENLSSKEIEKLKLLPSNLKSKIIWQDDAIDSIIKSIMRSKAWIWNPNRPLWSFLFLWPTWVWKTELVKILSKEFYWNETSLIKIDMSEYSDKTSANKLIWASAWYVWYEEWWLLTEKVRKKPYSIVLFDEIEKWDLEVYNLLLQILEDWILTDNKWRKINFKNTIIVMTSNIWQDEFKEKASMIWFNISDTEEEKVMQDFGKAREKIIWNLSEYFPTEFINRIDKIVVFNPLDKDKIKKIVKLQLDELANRLKLKSIDLIYDIKIINSITKKVYNPEFWAREVRRFIINNIEDQIAEILIWWTKKTDIFELIIEKDKIIVKNK